MPEIVHIEAGVAGGKESGMDTIRTYETFAIRWDRGSTWSGYRSADEAQAVIDGSAARGGSVGTLVRDTFEVLVPAATAHLYQPGIAERPAVAVAS